MTVGEWLYKRYGINKPSKVLLDSLVEDGLEGRHPSQKTVGFIVREANIAIIADTLNISLKEVRKLKQSYEKL